VLLAVTGTVAFLFFCTVVAVSFTLSHSFREHNLKRAKVLAVNDSDAAVGYPVAKKTAELAALLDNSGGGAVTA